MPSLFLVISECKVEHFYGLPSIILMLTESGVLTLYLLVKILFNKDNVNIDGQSNAWMTSVPRFV